MQASQSVAAAKQQFDDPDSLPTYVIGVGPFPSTNPAGYDPLSLGALASAGGASRPGCNANEQNDVTRLCYLQVTPNVGETQLAQDFVAATEYVLDSAPCR